MKIHSSAWIIIGALGLWFGVENPICYIPGLIFFYPLSLIILGHNAPGKVDALRAGWILGLLGSSLSLYWLAVPIHTIGGLPWLLACPCVVLVGGSLGFFSGLFSFFVFCFHHIQFWQKSLMLGLVWYLIEWIKSWFFTGFPWLPFTMGFARYPVMLQCASIIGSYALSGLYVAILCLVFYSILYSQSKDIHKCSIKWPLIRALSVACILFISIVLFGYITLKTNPIDMNIQDGVTIAIIQGNDDQIVKWNPQTKYRSAQKYVRASEELLKNIFRLHEGGNTYYPDVFLWPETVILFDFKAEVEKGIHNPLTYFVNKYQIPVIFGATGIETAGKDITIFNRLYYYSPGNYRLDCSESNKINKSLQWYDKEHLVPFGEYTPLFFNFPFLSQLLQEVGTYTPGEKVAPLLFEIKETVKKGSIACYRTISMGILICYEVIFPELARKRVAEGAQVFITVSNDSWFGHTIAPVQHLQIAQMRSIEFGRWMARAAVTGISAFIDPYGRIIDSTKIFIPTYLVGTIRPIIDNTVFFWIEPWLPTFAILVLCIMLWKNNLITHSCGHKSRGCS